jgi:hypothetical protein
MSEFEMEMIKNCIDDIKITQEAIASLSKNPNHPWIKKYQDEIEETKKYIIELLGVIE